MLVTHDGLTHCVTHEPDQDEEEEKERWRGLLRRRIGRGKTSRDRWAVGETVRVWDTDVPQILA
jgi:hypothetical protein